MKKIHDSKIKNRIFNVGDRVLLFNSRLKIFSRKLKTRWSGPFTITKVFPYGTVELSQPDGPNFKVNGHRVKHYFGGDVPQLGGFITKCATGQGCWVFVGESRRVMGSSWSVEEWQEEWGDDSCSFGGSGLNNTFYFKRGGKKTWDFRGFYTIGSCG
nr:reverse transcriptase domain-containing protein [Tanacetum cinerariifolium]